MSPSVTIRRASREDVERIGEITRKASGGRVCPDSSALLELLLEWAYLLSATTKVMGVVRWQCTDFVACLKDLYVYPSRQRRRVGTPLLRRVEEDARALSCEAALLLADERSSWRAIKFYRELGYERARMEQLAPPWREVAEEQRDQGEFVMVKKLEESQIISPAPA